MARTAGATGRRTGQTQRVSPGCRQAVPARAHPSSQGATCFSEISEKQARSIRYQIAIAKLPLAKDVDDFAFGGTPVNETLVRDLAGGNFVAHQRNVVLVGGTGQAWLSCALGHRACRDNRSMLHQAGAAACWRGLGWPAATDVAATCRRPSPACSS